jgi:hypothetical protein
MTKPPWLDLASIFWGSVQKLVYRILVARGGIDRVQGFLTLLESSLLQQVFYIGCKTTCIDVALKVSSLQNSGSFLYRRRLGNQEMLQSSIDS